jgi:hypothetical protein
MDISQPTCTSYWETMTMWRMLIAVLCAAGLLLLTASESRGDGVWRRAPRNVVVRPSWMPHAGVSQPRPVYANPYEYYNEIYPKYYGAFHSRYILQYGYPSGDIGLRGFPW